MVMGLQMPEFLHNDVHNAMKRYLGQICVKGNLLCIFMPFNG